MKLFCSLLIAAMLAPAQSQPAAQVEGDKIREYLLAHPEVIIEALQLYQMRQKQAAADRSKTALTSERKNIFEDPTSPTAGATKDAVTIVEFFDYRCGYCKKVAPTVAKVLSENPKVRVVYKEFPILGPDSELASKAALAAQQQGAYDKFHKALMGRNGGLNLQAIEEVARGLSLNVDKLKADMNSEKIMKTIEGNARLAGALGVESTPSFVIGNELIPGAIDESAMLALIAKASQPAPK